MNTTERLIRDLPDPESAGRFLQQLEEQNPLQAKKLSKKEGLLSDVLTLASYSPLIATSLLQNPEYLWWLDRERTEQGVRSKDSLLESLARFSLTNSTVEPNILFARFRRRELTRIFLADIRRLLTIAEITEGISNIADAILENAIRIADQDLQNRFGVPQETDEKGRRKTASFCVVSLGKLGSRELNYSSDIDLLFLYSEEGATSSTGTRDPVTNREYFSKLAQSITHMVGSQAGEGASYRVDMRLRPNGRVGPLALTVQDTVRYYKSEARNWERQVLIRSRSSAGDATLYQQFFSAVEGSVFSIDRTVADALRDVGLSKQKINLNHRGEKGDDVKLGTGGIREIEFIAQALQLAHGGRDEWLRSPHTLISLSRLAERKLIGEIELSALSEAYEFLRRLEHVLQMENGLQTHTVPTDTEKRALIAKRMKCDSPAVFESALARHRADVHGVFERLFTTQTDFDSATADTGSLDDSEHPHDFPGDADSSFPPEIRLSLEKSGVNVTLDQSGQDLLNAAASVSHRVVELIAAAPHLINEMPRSAATVRNADFSKMLGRSTDSSGFGFDIAELRKNWSRIHLQLMVLDATGELPLYEVKSLQTKLAEASIEAALNIVEAELARKYRTGLAALKIAVLGLGKLGSGGIDFDSDLDLIMVYDPQDAEVCGVSAIEFYARAVELFVTALSGVTRDGSLYRIDLRLRPYGKNGGSVISSDAFVEYVEGTAAIWELLAFVKLRAAGGDRVLANSVESRVRSAIHQRAIETDFTSLSNETRDIRLRLEQERSSSLGKKEIDIKFGPGGMLDIYFAVRYLQLRDNIPDNDAVRSTGQVLDRLRERKSISDGEHDVLRRGYDFLSALDHNIRLTIGRSTRLPHAGHKALSIIAGRINCNSPDALLQMLSLHRIEIRSAFEQILGDRL